MQVIDGGNIPKMVRGFAVGLPFLLARWNSDPCFQGNMLLQSRELFCTAA